MNGDQEKAGPHKKGVDIAEKISTSDAFEKTHWSRVLAARGSDQPGAGRH